MRDESKELTLRVHDECNGSDVFGSDICTCKPYLVYAMEECIRCVEANNIQPVLDPKVFSLDEAKEAYQYMWDKKHFGKVAIKIE